MNSMKELDEYGKGRESVILEMLEWAGKQMDLLKKHGRDSDSHISATMSGQMKAYDKMKQKLVSKLRRLKTVE